MRTTLPPANSANESAQRVALAANGVDLTEGSDPEILTSTDVLGEGGYNTIHANAVRATWGQRTQATNLQIDAMGKRFDRPRDQSQHGSRFDAVEWRHAGGQFLVHGHEREVMPRVPEYSNFQATPSAQPSVRFNPSQAPDAGEVNASRPSKWGRPPAVGRHAGPTGSGRGQDANETRVIDAVNKARSACSTCSMAGHGLPEPQGATRHCAGLTTRTWPTVRGQVQGTTGPLRRELGNDQQREMFRRATANLQTQMYGDAQLHQASEFKTYRSAPMTGR